MSTSNGNGQRSGPLSLYPNLKPELGGRKKGSRNRLSEAFLCDILSDWEKHGPKALELLRVKKPYEYVRIVSTLIPKEYKAEVSTSLLDALVGVEDDVRTEENVAATEGPSPVREDDTESDPGEVAS
jgi:hypothetical protein